MATTKEMVKSSGIPGGPADLAIVREDFIENMEGLQTKVVTINTSTQDFGNAAVNAYKLRAGLVMSILDSGGNYMEYDDTKSDGRENARGVLMSNVDYEVSVATTGVVGWGCTFRSSGLHGLDAAAKVDLIARATKFNDTP